MYHKQQTDYTCGPSALRNALSNLGFEYPEKYLAELLKTNNKRGTWSRAFVETVQKLPIKIQVIELHDTNIDKIKELRNGAWEVITCFFANESKEDHYTLIKEIKNDSILFQDPWYGNNYSINLSVFNEIWHCDYKFENTQKWIFAIRLLKIES